MCKVEEKGAAFNENCEPRRRRRKREKDLAEGRKYMHVDPTETRCSVSGRISQKRRDLFFGEEVIRVRTKRARKKIPAAT